MVTILKRSKEFFQSLRFRILLIILILGILPLVILETAFLQVTEDTVIKTRMTNVSARYSMLSTYISQAITTENGIDDAKLNVLVNDMAGIFANRIQIIDSNFNIVNDTYKINKGKICISQDVNKCFNGTNVSYADKESGYLIFTQAVFNANTGEIEYVLFATEPITDIMTAMSNIRVFGAAITVILVILVIFFAIFMSYKVVKPFRNIDDTIEEIGNGQTGKSIELAGCTEVKAISDSFNTMIDRINQLEDSRQEFVSNVSHELKTPMTSMKVLADSLLHQDDVPAELYREFMQDIVEEIDRENRIISDLLQLVKIDNAHTGLSISQVNINKMLESALKVVRPLAEKKNIELVLESYRTIVADADETKLSMAFMNLVENAIKYNNNDGWVHVSLNADQTYFYIKIQDGGIGIPEDAQEHIFDRFYRVDKARDRATGGTGLGLAITKSIVLAHNGNIKLYSEEGVGTTFNMQIPLTWVTPEREKTPKNG